MILKKITTGFVIQTYDTRTHKFIGQEFIAGDECDYEDAEGNPFDSTNMSDEESQFFYDQYLPYEMVQPILKNKKGKKK